MEMEKDLPKNWALPKLKQIVKYQKGKKPKILNKEEFDGSVPYLDIKAFEKDEVRRYADVASSTLIKKDEIGIVWDGARSGWVSKNKAGAVGSTIAILKPVGVNSDLLYRFLESKFDYLNTNTRGIGIPHVDPNVLWDIDFPFPPLPEQTRIVAKLDQLFGQLEQIKESLENLQSIKSRFLYSCLVDQKKNEFFKRIKIGQFLEEGTERIGDAWKECRLIGVSAKEGITDLRVGQKKTFEKYKIVRKGDFIYNTMRVNIGSIAIYKGDVPAITSPDYVVFRANNKLSSDLLLGFLKSDQGLLEIGANTKGSVRARLYFKSLSEVRLPYGGIAIQRIAQEFLNTYNVSLQKMEDIFNIKIPQLEQAILHKAFKGELVPHLESDGDARELLEEIKALKKQTGKPKAKKANVRVKANPNVRVSAVEPLKKSKGYKVDDVELDRVVEESANYNKD